MCRTYENELNSVYGLLDHFKTKFARVLYESSQLYVLEAQEPAVRISITVGSHGNEFAGIAALNLFISDLLSGGFGKNVSLTFGLGNIEAGRANKRFIERDLNRCFGNLSDQYLEDKIAREYESWIPRTDFNLDFHQTVEPSETAFFVGPDNSDRQVFASQIDETLPIMTFPAGSFSVDGAPLDEYLLNKPTLGLTVELGQIGFDEKQIQFARNLMHSYLRACLAGVNKSADRNFRVYRQKTIIANSPNKDSFLREGIKNLSPLSIGELVGTSTSGPLLCPESGIALFPKYGDMAKISSELCQIMVLADPLLQRSP